MVVHTSWSYTHHDRQGNLPRAEQCCGVFRRGLVLSSRPGLFEMLMPDDDQHTLKMLRVKLADVGQMVCVASNKCGSDSCTFSVEMAGEFLTLPRITATHS